MASTTNFFRFSTIRVRHGRSQLDIMIIFKRNFHIYKCITKGTRIKASTDMCLIMEMHSKTSFFWSVSRLLSSNYQLLNVVNFYGYTCTSSIFLLPPSENVRRLSFSQKSTSSKFDQVYMKKILISTISNGHFEKLYFMVNLLIFIWYCEYLYFYV
jgi:hypothetical protein